MKKAMVYLSMTAGLSLLPFGCKGHPELVKSAKEIEAKKKAQLAKGSMWLLLFKESKTRGFKSTGEWFNTEFACKALALERSVSAEKFGRDLGLERFRCIKSTPTPTQ